VLRCGSAVGLALAARLAWPQINPGFELAQASAPAAGATVAAEGVPGWRVRGDTTVVALDHTVANSGRYSLRIGSSEADRRGITQVIDARQVSGDRLRLTAYVRAAPPATAESSLRVRIDGGGRLLYIARESEARDVDATGWRRIALDAPISTRAERIEIGAEVSGAGTVWLDDFAIESFDARTLPPTSPVAARYVEHALADIEEHAVTRAALDWPAYRHAVLLQARGATTESDAHLAVQFALAELADGHSYFMSPRQMSRLDAEPLGNARSGRATRPPEARMLFDGIGYLRLPGISGGEHLDRVAFAEAVQALLGDLDSRATTGWILDLRGNEGGNLWPMLAGVGPLLGDGDVGASLRPDGERRSIWYRDGRVGLGDYVQLRVRGEPVRLNPNVRVAVLLDDDTASAAENVALAFAGRPAARSFGSPTAGATAATRTFPLSDGAALMLAVASITDRMGRIVDGPVMPDERVADGGLDSAPLEAQAAVVAARQWLELSR